MIDITKLVNEWRKNAKWTDSVCPPQLEAALPTFTEVTDDHDWDDHCLYAWKNSDGEWENSTFTDMPSFYRKHHGVLVYSRPLCSLDFPPDTDDG